MNPCFKYANKIGAAKFLLIFPIHLIVWNEKFQILDTLELVYLGNFLKIQPLI